MFKKFKKFSLLEIVLILGIVFFVCMFFLTILKNMYVATDNSLPKQAKTQSTEYRTQNTEQSKIAEDKKTIETMDKSNKIISKENINDNINNLFIIPWYEKPPYIDEEKVQQGIEEYKNEKTRQFKNNYYKGIIKSKNK